MRTKTWMLLSATALLLAACLPGVNAYVGTAASSGQPAGFWYGLWHGALVWLTFIISLFTDDVQLYEVHNNGNWYDAGYFLGLLIALGGSHGARGRVRRK